MRSAFSLVPPYIRSSGSAGEVYGLPWFSEYGFYESADFTATRDRAWRHEPQLVRCWMAHHQGMALLALCNLLFDCPIQRYFHDEPQVMATELLLHERLPTSVMAEAQPEPAAHLPANCARASVSAYCSSSSPIEPVAAFGAIQDALS